MSEATRRKIRQLRALAASTTFPEEAASARAKADKLEAALGPQQQQGGSTTFHRAKPFPDVGSSISPEMMQMMADFIRKRMDAHLYAAMYGTAYERDGEPINPFDIFVDPGSGQ